MPLGVGVALGKKLMEKAVDSMGDAAVDAVKAPRTRKRKKSAKRRIKGNVGWVIVLIALGIVLFALMSHTHHLR
jgi:hypothetical protein